MVHLHDRNLKKTENDITHISLHRFTVRLTEYEEFIATRQVNPGLWQHFLQSFRKCAPPNINFAMTNIAHHDLKLDAKVNSTKATDERALYDCFSHCAKGHLRTIFVLKRFQDNLTKNTHYELHYFQHGKVYDSATLKTLAILKSKFKIDNAVSHELSGNHAQ